MKKVLIDAHTHTIASGHAYSSLQEMAKAAADKGLQVLGITEHGPSVLAHVRCSISRICLWFPARCTASDC